MKKPASHQRLEFLDALRGIAVLVVFSFHCVTAAFHTGIFNHIFGEAGVAIFFAISGFCIHLSFCRRSDWSVFWLRRFFRLYPAYFLAVILFSAGPMKDTWQISTHLLLIHNLFAKTMYGLNSDFWSIAVELQLYAAYPLLLLLARNIGWRTTVWAIGILEFSLRLGVGVLTTVIGIQVPVWLIGMPFFYWLSWSVGAMVAESYVKKEESPFVRCSALLFVFVGIASAFVIDTLCFTFYAIAAAVVIAKAIRSPVKYLPALSAHVGRTGLWSYSFYLIHHPIIGLTVVALKSFELSPWLTFPVYLALYPLILGIAGGLYALVERPGMAIGTLILRKPASALPAFAE